MSRLQGLLARHDYERPARAFESIRDRWSERGYTFSDLCPTVVEGDKIVPLAVPNVGHGHALVWEPVAEEGGESWKLYLVKPGWSATHPKAAMAIVRSFDPALIPPRQYVGTGHFAVLSGIANVYDQWGKTVAQLTPDKPVYDIASGTILFVRFNGAMLSLALEGISPIQLSTSVYPPARWKSDGR